MGKIQFSSNDGSFTMKQPENYSDLYFPIAGEKGIKSSVTPDLGGDSKINQETFLIIIKYCLKKLQFKQLKSFC